jgi:hypothetical protein
MMGDNTHHHLVTLLLLLLLPKKLASSFITKSGRSSGVQCPESGTMTPCTFEAKDCVELNVGVPGSCPPNAGYIAPAKSNNLPA